MNAQELQARINELEALLDGLPDAFLHNPDLDGAFYYESKPQYEEFKSWVICRRGRSMNKFIANTMYDEFVTTVPDMAREWCRKMMREDIQSALDEARAQLAALEPDPEEPEETEPIPTLQELGVESAWIASGVIRYDDPYTGPQVVQVSDVGAFLRFLAERVILPVALEDARQVAAKTGEDFNIDKNAFSSIHRDTVDYYNVPEGIRVRTSDYEQIAFTHATYSPTVTALLAANLLRFALKGGAE